MTVTTRLVGKLGGGGAPEMATAQVASTGFVRIPSGWGKAMGVFAGTATAASPTVFGTTFKGMSAGSFLNGGGVVNRPTYFDSASGTITWVRLE